MVGALIVACVTIFLPVDELSEVDAVRTAWGTPRLSRRQCAGAKGESWGSKGASEHSPGMIPKVMLNVGDQELRKHLDREELEKISKEELVEVL